MEIADGGGVRVYSSLLVLNEIMETIIRREKSYLDEPIKTYGPVESSYHPLVPHKADVWLPCHYFDYIGGAGCGGLVAIMLGRLRMNIHDSILAFEALLKEAFYHKRWFHYRSLLFWPRAKFDHQILEQAIQNLVSHHTPGVPGFLRSSNFATNENQCGTIVLAFRREEGSREHQGTPYLFRTYKNFHLQSSRQRLSQNLGLAHHIPVWQVARATTASPTFYRPVIIDDHEYVGGSFGIHNPSAEIYDEVLNMSVDNIDIILSIGTGKHRIRSRIHQFLEFRPGYNRLEVEALSQMKVDEWQAGGRVRTNIRSLIGRHRSKKKAATPEESIRKHTGDYLNREDVQSKINDIARILVQRRRNRVKSDLERWEKFCYETWYHCKIHGCLEPEEEYSSRRALQIHILDKHSDKYSRWDQEALEAALDEGQIRVV